MFNITIGFTEPEPSKDFTQQVENMVKASGWCEAETCSSKKLIQNIEIAQIADKNLEDFSRKLKDRLMKASTREDLAITSADISQQVSSNSANLSEGAHEQFNLLIFNIKKIRKSIPEFLPLFKMLSNTDCAVLFLDPKGLEFKNIVLKYEGTATSSLSILSFYKLFPEKAKHAESVTLISPLAFKKSKVAVEKRFVKKITAFYANLGFIKLPLSTVAEFFNYSVQNRANLLILPKTDMIEILGILTEKESGYRPEGNDLSIFVGF